MSFNLQTYQPHANLLQGQIILVTGAGDGIGRQAALSYASHGATLILLGRTRSKLEAVYDQIQALGGATPAIVVLDLLRADNGDYRGLALSLRQQFGRLDGLLLNAGLLGSLSPIEHVDMSEFHQVMQVNVTASLQLLQNLLPLLRQSAAASVILTSSSVGKRGRAYWGSYALSKFATEGLMQVLADELANTTIRVNCLNPGATRTRMRAQAYPGEDPQTLKTPAQLMPLYLYLMGADSLHVHGQSLDAQPRVSAPA